MGGNPVFFRNGLLEVVVGHLYLLVMDFLLFSFHYFYMIRDIYFYKEHYIYPKIGV